MTAPFYKGLSDSEVLASRKKYGENVLLPPERESVWLKLGRKFLEPLVIVLMTAGLLSIAIACYNFYADTAHHGIYSVFFEPVGIFVAILLATTISFYFEQKAEKEFSVLNQVNDDEPVMVVRNGNTCEIPKREVVVGDIILLSTGQEVPADARLLESVSLCVDESSLTGEPLCIKCANGEDGHHGETYPANHVMRGTKVMEGHAVAEVFAVGHDTENGKVFVAAQIDNGVQTPLNEQLEALAKHITRFSYFIAIVLVIGRLVYLFFSVKNPTFWDIAQYALESVMLAVALIVCAVPEGLPMAVSLCLALSMRKMLRTNNLVRRLHACETMGATTVICTDKTGTLTQNRMQVAHADFTVPDADGFPAAKLKAMVYEGIAVNSTAQLDFSGNSPRPLGNPTEGALLLWLYSEGQDYRSLRAQAEVLEETPFSTERKYMDTTVRSHVLPGQNVKYMKGAPEVVIAMCGKADASSQNIESKLLDYQRQAMRTLAFACSIDGGPWHLLGVVGISDPIRPEVPLAIEECRKAGIRVIIVTGDTHATAAEIGRQIGITDERDIISRAKPLDKKNLVERLQREGNVVAVTGDGTNDAPALKSAHVGLSMGDGTSVAKEASDITILDNSFVSITRAVMWGRSLYRNIQRFVLFQMTVCVVACMVVLVGAFTGTNSPLTVTQMLWVNLIMDTFAAMALASLPPNRNVMNERPRQRDAFIISREMGWQIILVGVAFGAFLLALLEILERGLLNDLFGVAYGRNGVLTEEGHSFFFTVFVFLQFWNLFNAAAFHSSDGISTLFRTRGFMLISGIIVLGQFLIVTFGGAMFNVRSLGICEWAGIILATSSVMLIGEIKRRMIKGGGGSQPT